VDQSRRELLKEQVALLLGASDMRQAAAAARALEHEQDVDLARALETGMMVCFMRPFTRSDLQVPEKWWPTGKDREHLNEIKAWRDKAFAHSDFAAGRWAEAVSYGEDETGRFGMQFREGWQPLPRGAVSDFVALCKRIDDDFTQTAASIQLFVDGHEFPPK
jgi:hypothetical protein